MPYSTDGLKPCRAFYLEIPCQPTRFSDEIPHNVLAREKTSLTRAVRWKLKAEKEKSKE
jgi:hypothetical protein